PSPPRPARLDATIRLDGTTVQGALTRSEVERGLQRVLPAFRACYAAAAARAGKNAAGAVKLGFVIDENGLAQSPTAGPAPLPGLDECVRDAARQVRTQLRPDIGFVTVTTMVTYSPLGP